MLVERQLAPALLMIGGVLVFPGLSQNPSHVSIGGMVAGSLLGGAGLFLSGIMVLASDHGKVLKGLVLFFLGLCALFLAGGDVFVALGAGNAVSVSGRILIGASGLAPLAGVVGGVVRGLR
ncbi:MAG: hypothetical protein AB1921_04935 [Thermodesulfobacteriota bacterium]